MENIQVKITPQDHMVTFDFSFEIAHLPGNGFVDCFIPGFGLVYSCPTAEDIVPTGAAMMKANFYFWMKEGNDTLKTVAIELHKRGFRAHNHNLTMKEIINKKRFRANFSPKSIPNMQGFENAPVLTENSQITVEA